MIITCDNCHTSFELDESLVKETGSKVRCTHCDHVFVAHPPARSKKSPEESPKKSPKKSIGDLLTDPDMTLEMEKIEGPREKSSAPEDEPEIVLNMETEDEPGLVLEMESGDPPSVKDNSLAADEDGLDLSDIEKMLEMDDAEDLDIKENEEEPELELAAAPGKKSGAAIDAPFDAPDELDLSDIEKLLEMGDVSETKTGDLEEEELKLELDEGSEKAAATFEAKPDGKEISLDLELSPEEDLKLELEEPVDLSLDLEEDDEAMETAAAVVSSKEKAAVADIDLDEPEVKGPAVKKAEPQPERIRKIQPQVKKFGMGEEKDAEDEKKPPAKPSPAFVTSLPLPKKSKTVPILITILLLIIAGGGLGVYYLNQKGKLSISNLPFGAKAGEIMAVEETFKHQIIANAKTGNLFVISGIVENAYNHPRSNIQITGELAKGGKTIQMQTVFCGNVISETDLAEAEMARISSRLSSPTGDNQSNVNVKPGARVPFMIVFANFPEDMEEYRIHIAGSSPSEK